MSTIVLTADRSLSSEYNKNEFLGFTATAPTIIPKFIYERILCPPVPRDNTKKDFKRAKFAHCGTRKIEAALLKHGFSEKDVVVCRPQDVKKVITKKTKIVGITANDPMGLGPASSTFSDMTGVETYSHRYFRELVHNPVIRTRGDIKVFAGGPGAWQLADERIRMRMGIDCVVQGEGEITVPQLFQDALDGKDIPGFVQGEVVPLDQIPTIKNPTINGLVEIARGCGRGCKFCNPTMLKFRCQSVENIVKEARINVAAGNGVLLHAEDVIRYKAKGPIPDEKEVIKLFTEIRKITPIIGISHFAMASALAKPKLIEDLSHILELSKKKWISGQTGIETGSPELACKVLMGKTAPFKTEKWPELVKQAHQLLCDNHWVPCNTLIFGLPGENRDDTRKTRELVYDLSKYKSLIVPLFFVPIGTMNKERFFRAKHMNSEHWKLFAATWDHNFKWFPELATEHFAMTNVGKFKGIAIKGMIKFAKRQMQPFLRIMREGRSPLVPENYL